ncbi:two-component sensor histidine kinase [Streptomyces chrestomyceticus JCM 4735]|uniref:histidine kinase n=1 Tax=Streptomyces chrestomyceticus JCM 4735 TaxID=1306181 RepID=A0A7U9KQI1_9ACTN|nr:ATP-binding protein [Streptomyces chrestomyceticus]GCD32972.1 two-component sensor histidine kinase [Streptomyces chrestomyceticus JCM 4735]
MRRTLRPVRRTSGGRPSGDPKRGRSAPGRSADGRPPSGRPASGPFAKVRWTIRLRLTLLYGALFLVTGVLLLTVVYLLVAGRPPWAGVEPPAPPAASVTPSGLGLGADVPAPTVDLEQQLQQQRSDYLEKLLTSSGIALVLLTFLSVWLGWLMAGRALRPLRTMADTAKEISANDLHRRLGAPGPSDEIKDLADTFDALLDHLEGAFEAQRRFVANASHELRTPLTFERSLLEITLADPDASAAELRETCVRVLGSNARQEKLIEALLTLARSQRGLDRRVPVELAALAADHLDRPRDTDGPAGVRIGGELAPAAVLGDPPLVERLIINLVDNAVRHNVPGGQVRVRTGLCAGRPALSVRNTGPEVLPSQLELIFQPFQRLRATRLGGHDGQGIGLSIVAAIAAAHDADLHAEALPEGGLEIRVEFPPVVH